MSQHEENVEVTPQHTPSSGAGSRNGHPHDNQSLLPPQIPPTVVVESKQIVKSPVTFTGQRSQDVRRWFLVYRNLSRANGWHNQTQIDNLPAFFEGLALDLWLELPPGLALDEIEKRFVDKFAPVGESNLAWTTLRNRFQSELETIDEFSNACLQLSRTASPNKSLTDQKRHS